MIECVFLQWLIMYFFFPREYYNIMKKIIFSVFALLFYFNYSPVFGQYYFPIEPGISFGIMNTMHPQQFADRYKVGMSGDISVRWRINRYIAFSGELYYGHISPGHKEIIKLFSSFIYSPPYSPDNIIIEKGGASSLFSIYPYIFITLNPQSKIKFSISGGGGYYRIKINEMWAMKELIDGLWKTTISFSSYIIYKPGANLGILISYPMSKRINFHFKALYHIIYANDEPLHFISAVLGICTNLNISLF